MKKTLYFLLGVIVVLAAVIIFNTLSLQSRQVTPESLPDIKIPEQVYQNLSEAVQFQTVSYSEESIPDSAAFNGFHNFLSNRFPLVHQNLRLEKINQYSLLYTWEGSNPEKKPLILMSHQDVVPVDQPTIDKWEAGPFEGKITDTHIIGRGTMDDKGSLMALLESVEQLLKEGFSPTQTIYLAFGHDEEVGGQPI